MNVLHKATTRAQGKKGLVCCHLPCIHDLLVTALPVQCLLEISNVTALQRTSHFLVTIMSSKAARPGWINWRSSEAQGILLEDLIQGTLPEELSAEQAWDVYKDRLEFSGVVFQQFKERLRDHRKQVKNNPGPSGSKRKRNEVNPDFIKWEKSEPRAILIEDLVQGVLPLDDEEMTHETAWNILYKDMKEFSEVCFAQFKARLRDHRKQVKQGLLRSKHEEECMERDRRLFPRKESNGDGKPNFDLHPAKLLLRADVKNKKHKQMKPSKLRMSRPEYQAFDNDHF